MPLPHLLGNTLLSTLTLSSNAFFGELPSVWSSLIGLTSLVATRNQIQSPINAIGALPKLATVDLSWNGQQRSEDRRRRGGCMPMLTAGFSFLVPVLLSALCASLFQR
jgi:hypothetical protein